VAIDRPTTTRGATAPLFFVFVPETYFVLDTKIFPGLVSWPSSRRRLRDRCPRPQANAEDRKRIERKRSQKLGQKKGAYAPLIF